MHTGVPHERMGLVPLLPRTDLVTYYNGCQAIVPDMDVTEVALCLDGLPLPGLGSLHYGPSQEVETFSNSASLKVAA